MLRKLEAIDKTNFDVLIVDHVGSEWLEHCIPEKCNWYTLKVRGVIPFVKSFSFFYYVIACVIKYGVNSVSLLSAIILDLKPRVVITFIDNNTFMGRLQEIFPDVLVISVQNGMRREGDPTIATCSSFPNYFGFGEHMLHMIKSYNCSVVKYYPVGSLKLGIFLSSIYRKKTEKKRGFVICFISQYVPEIAKSSDRKSVKYMESFRRMCEVLVHFSKNKDVIIDVAMRSELVSAGYQEELNFFRESLDSCNVVFHANEHSQMHSYQKGLDADLVLGFHSTLLYELFGVGKKVILFGQVDPELVSMLGCKSMFDNMPNECLLNSWSFEEFRAKVELLTSMSDRNYFNETQRARKYHMKFGDKYPHQVIYNLIKEKCE